MTFHLIALFSILCFVQPTIASSFSYVQLQLKDSTQVSGELIEVYEDRWFWETPSSLENQYSLIFELKNDKSIFHFVRGSDIVKSRLKMKSISLYRSYLRRKNIVFTHEVIKNETVLTGNEGHHKFEKMYGNFAWDVANLDANGSQFIGNGANLSDYAAFGKDVYSPVRGIVVGKVSGQMDNLPSPLLSGDLSGKENNYLTIKLDGPFYVSLVHFKKDSIQVEVGDTVEPGQVLGQVGNSGVSYTPHLHYTLYVYLPEWDRFISVPSL